MLFSPWTLRLSISILILEYAVFPAFLYGLSLQSVHGSCLVPLFGHVRLLFNLQGNKRIDFNTQSSKVKELEINTINSSHSKCLYKECKIKSPPPPCCLTKVYKIPHSMKFTGGSKLSCDCKTGLSASLFNSAKQLLPFTNRAIRLIDTSSKRYSNLVELFGIKTCCIANYCHLEETLHIQPCIVYRIIDLN